MSVLAKLPTMTEDDLVTLLSNAMRLERVGTDAQRTAASDVVPAIRDELAARRKARIKEPPVRPATRTPARAARKTPAPKARQ